MSINTKSLKSLLMSTVILTPLAFGTVVSANTATNTTTSNSAVSPSRTTTDDNPILTKLGTIQFNNVHQYQPSELPDAPDSTTTTNVWQSKSNPDFRIVEDSLNQYILLKNKVLGKFNRINPIIINDDSFYVPNDAYHSDTHDPDDHSVVWKADKDGNVTATEYAFVNPTKTDFDFSNDVNNLVHYDKNHGQVVYLHGKDTNINNHISVLTGLDYIEAPQNANVQPDKDGVINLKSAFTSGVNPQYLARSVYYHEDPTTHTITVPKMKNLIPPATSLLNIKVNFNAGTVTGAGNNIIGTNNWLQGTEFLTSNQGAQGDKTDTTNKTVHFVNSSSSSTPKSSSLSSAPKSSSSSVPHSSSSHSTSSAVSSHSVSSSSSATKISSSAVSSTHSSSFSSSMTSKSSSIGASSHSKASSSSSSSHSSSSVVKSSSSSHVSSSSAVTSTAKSSSSSKTASTSVSSTNVSSDEHAATDSQTSSVDKQSNQSDSATSTEKTASSTKTTPAQTTPQKQQTTNHSAQTAAAPTNNDNGGTTTTTTTQTVTKTIPTDDAYSPEKAALLKTGVRVLKGIGLGVIPFILAGLALLGQQLKSKLKLNHRKQ